MPTSKKELRANSTTSRVPAELFVGRPTELEHLLKVVASVGRDASESWAVLWEELKKCSSPGGAVVRDGANGFVPSCGWPEFLEKFWELKHYLDSIQRICRERH